MNIYIYIYIYIIYIYIYVFGENISLEDNTQLKIQENFFLFFKYSSLHIMMEVLSLEEKNVIKSF